MSRSLSIISTILLCLKFTALSLQRQGNALNNNMVSMGGAFGLIIRSFLGCLATGRRKVLPYKNPDDLERVVKGLRKAGLPES